MAPVPFDSPEYERMRDASRLQTAVHFAHGRAVIGVQTIRYALYALPGADRQKQRDSSNEKGSQSSHCLDPTGDGRTPKVCC